MVILTVEKDIIDEIIFCSMSLKNKVNEENKNGRLQTLPLMENDIQKIKALQSDWGLKTEISNIDSIVYRGA